MQVPYIDLPLHTPILFFEIPNPGLEGAVFLLHLVNNTFEVIIFLPYDILRCHITVEIDIGGKDIIIGIDLFLQRPLVLNSFLELPLLLPKLVILTT